MAVVHHRALAPLISRIVRKNPLVMCVTNRVTPQRVADLVAQTTVVVFSKSYCPFCRKVKALLKELGVSALPQRQIGC